MSVIRRNIVSNLLGSVWITVLTLAITPLQVNLLGIEAYGLIGFIATLQIIFTMFDLGLSSTVTRQIAMDHSPGHQDSKDLLRTAMTIYWGFACVVGVILAASSEFIANHWFNTTALSAKNVEHCLYAITFYLAARWPVAFYSGVLMGLQRMDVLNIVKTATATLRLLGGIGVLLVWPDLTVFLWWTAFNAIVEVIAYVAVCRKTTGIASWRFGFSLAALKAVWGFSLSMSALSMLALLISQLDRLMLSKMLSLEDLGYYTLAYNTASTISLGISAVSSAMMPSFAAAHCQAASGVLSRRYDQANRVILFVVGLAAFPLIFFGDAILSAWVGPTASTGASRPLALLAMGFWLSAVLSNAYSVTIATGHPGMPLKLSALSAVPYAITLYFLVLTHGIDGAALAWLLLNLTYVIFLIPSVHRSLLMVSTRRWAVRTVLPFAMLGCASFALPRLALNYLSSVPHNAITLTALLVAVAAYAAWGYWLLGPNIRAEGAALLGFKGRPQI